MILDLEHYVTTHLEYDKPNIAVIHIGSKNVSYNGLNIDASILAKKIIKIGNKCIDYGVEEVVFSPVFVKESIRLTFIIRSINGQLPVSCFIKKLYFISNAKMTRKYLCGIHLAEADVNI